MRFGSTLAVFGLLITAACGSSETIEDTGPHTTKVEPSSPLGTVWGAVLSAGTHDALEGAMVTLSAAAETRATETDDAGLFAFDEVPAGGEVGVSVSHPDYTRATMKVRVPGETGDFPAEGIGAFVGPVALFPLDGEVIVQLLGHDGAEVNGATARATASAAWVDLEDGSRERGFVSRGATSEGGHLFFSELPNLLDLAQYGARVDLTIEPVYDDGVLEYMGHAESRTASDLVARGGRFTVTLNPPGEDQALSPIASNVGSLMSDGTARPGDSVVGINEAIRVAFNQPVNSETIDATVFDHSGEAVHPTVTRVENGNVVRVAPDGETYTQGRGYHVVLQVQALGTSSPSNRISLSGSFFARPQDGEIKAVGVDMEDVTGSGMLEAGDIVHVDVSQSIGLGAGQTGFSFPVYINLDLDGSGEIGDAPGELGSGEPVWAQAVEPNPPSPMVPSGFTRHFRFTMPNVPPADGDPTNSYSYATGVGIEFQIDLGSSLPTYERLMRPTGELVHTPAELETATIDF